MTKDEHYGWFHSDYFQATATLLVDMWEASGKKVPLREYYADGAWWNNLVNLAQSISEAPPP